MSTATRSVRALAFLSVAATLTGCAAPGEDPFADFEFREGDTDGVTTDGTVTTEERETEARDGSPGGGGIWINNGLSAPSTGGIDPAYALSTPQGLSETEGVLTSVDTRVVAEYLVECALPEGASITKSVGSETFVLEGELGLAPEWENGDCDEDCQQWVTACMLARTNITEVTVKISLRGDHPAVGFDGHPAYPVYESSFFGNIFADPNAQYVCRNEQDPGASNHLEQRACWSDPAACGFVAYSDCQSAGRCTFVDVDGDVVATDCAADGDPSTFHTLSVYIQN